MIYIHGGFSTSNCNPLRRGLAPKALALPATWRRLQHRCGLQPKGQFWSPKSSTNEVSFDPSSKLFYFEECQDPAVESSRWRLLNPGRVAMNFQDFLSACRSTNSKKDDKTTASLVNIPYDADELSDTDPEVGLAPLEIPVDDLKELALYCVEDASGPPWADLLEDFGSLDPVSQLPLETLRWQLKERRIWMSSGGAKGASSVSAGFHWDHMQNVHVVLSGSKEVFLVPPLLAPALRATRFCPQAQWQMDCNSNGRMTLRKVPMESTESSTDYALVSVEQSLSENLRRHPEMAEDMKESPFKVLLEPGDAIYIPPGWWHSIRTHRPSPGHGLPMALSVNFWYDLPPELKKSYASVLLTLEILSRQRAMSELPQDRISELLSEPIPAKETEDSLEFEVVD
eukprot:s661_g17.t2